MKSVWTQGVETITTMEEKMKGNSSVGTKKKKRFLGIWISNGFALA